MRGLIFNLLSIKLTDHEKADDCWQALIEMIAVETDMSGPTDIVLVNTEVDLSADSDYTECTDQDNLLEMLDEILSERK